MIERSIDVVLVIVNGKQKHLVSTRINWMNDGNTRNTSSDCENHRLIN